MWALSASEPACAAGTGLTAGAYGAFALGAAVAPAGAGPGLPAPIFAESTDHEETGAPDACLAVPAMPGVAPGATTNPSDRAGAAEDGCGA
jgi:hypothetical protein